MSHHGMQRARAALAAIIGLGVWAGLARADKPVWKYHNGMTEAPPGVIADQRSRRPFMQKIRSFLKVPCWASFNGYTCGSCRSEMTFIFGSCRSFFGEPCLNGPPPSPLPPWLNMGTPGTRGGPPAPDPWGPDSPWAPGGQGGFPLNPHPTPDHHPYVPHPELPMVPHR